MRPGRGSDSSHTSLRELSSARAVGGRQHPPPNLWAPHEPPRTLSCAELPPPLPSSLPPSQPGGAAPARSVEMCRYRSSCMPVPLPPHSTCTKQPAQQVGRPRSGAYEAAQPARPRHPQALAAASRLQQAGPNPQPVFTAGRPEHACPCPNSCAPGGRAPPIPPPTTSPATHLEHSGVAENVIEHGSLVGQHQEGHAAHLCRPLGQAVAVDRHLRCAGAARSGAPRQRMLSALHPSTLRVEASSAH